MGMLWGDIRYSWRTLGRNPGFAAAAVLVLGLGIGAATSVFSIVNGVLLQSLPYEDPDRLVMLFSAYADGGNRSIVSGMDFMDWQKQSRSFEGLAVVRSQEARYLHEEGTDAVKGMCVSANLFSILRWQPLWGRTFLPEETWPNNQYIVLGYDFWKRHLNGEEAILGKAITLGGIRPSTYTVVGVMPPGIRFLEAKNDAFVDFWIPVDRDLAEIQSGGRGCLRWRVVGRLKPGVGVEEARTEMDGIAERIAKSEYADSSAAPGVNVVPLHDYVVGDTSPLILLAGCGGGLVLLVACANAGGLILARGLARRRELATRATLGAGWLQLLRQAVAESVLLSLFGGLLGVLLALAGVAVFRRIAPSDMVRLEEIHIDPATLLFALGLVLLSGVFVGLVPALRTCRPDLSETLKADNRGVTLDRGRRRLANVFVASEVSLCLVLLIGSGLLVNSLSRLLLLDPGYRTDNVLAARLEGMRSEGLQDLLMRIRSLPGVQSAAIVYGVPLCDVAGGGPILPEGRQESQVGRHSITARIVSPGYFHLMGIPLLRGRDFSESDTEDSARVAVINESMAERFWPDEDPIGKRFVFGWTGGMMEVVGVARDTRSIALDAPPIMEAFVSAQQQEGLRSWLLVATDCDPMNLVKPLRAEARLVNPNAVVCDVRTMADIVAKTLAVRRLLTVVLSVFSCGAAILASLGIYGVVAHSVRRRTAEIGIRMALGATSGQVLTAVLREGLKLSAVGVVLGLAGALLATRVLAGFLYEVDPLDSPTFTAMTALLVAVALAASYVPARRAAKVDPMTALRCE